MTQLTPRYTPPPARITFEDRLEHFPAPIYRPAPFDAAYQGAQMRLHAARLARGEGTPKRTRPCLHVTDRHTATVPGIELARDGDFATFLLALDHEVVITARCRVQAGGAALVPAYHEG